jgi:hypothetical protein
MAPLTGKVVIVTGASSGFGAAAARLFAREGCKVVLAARRLDRLDELAKHHRRYTIFPWYYPIAIWIDFNAPWLVDWFVVGFQTPRTHRLEAQ